MRQLEALGFDSYSASDHPTFFAVQAIGPRYLMPGHCTGWRATHAIARAMPDAFVPTSVGTTLALS